MFIAHLPAAYLAIRLWPMPLSRTAIAGGLVGSVLPDADLFLFYFVDGRAFHHHEYLTHRPALWLFLLGLGAWHARARRNPLMLSVSLAALLHLCLDTVSGSIAWGWPLTDWAVPLVVVPATHDFWVMSFVTHWTFKLEIMISLIAAIAVFNAQKNPAQ